VLAISLRATKLSDTSLIVTWFSETEGKLRTAAKGARRVNSPMAGRVDLFCLSDISIAKSRRGDLHVLREAKLVEGHEALRMDYSRFQMASYFASLLDTVTEVEHPAPELFNLLRRALGHLTKSEPTLPILKRFELRLVAALGVHDGGDPAVSLLRILHRLPAERARLLNDLSANKSGPGISSF
jgi:DNA repair protein RecO (recombination protein O)